MKKRFLMAAAALTLAVSTAAAPAAALPVFATTISAEDSTSLYPGEQEYVEIDVDSDVDGSQIKWSVDDSDIAQIDHKTGRANLIYARSNGTTYVTVTVIENGRITATKDIKVHVHHSKNDDVHVQDITLSQHSIQIAKGDDYTLTASFTPSNATNQSLNWSSSNENVAKVHSSGRIEARAVGSATITAVSRDSGHHDTCTVWVYEGNHSSTMKHVRSVELDESLTLTAGQSQQITAYLHPHDADDRTIYWTSSNTKVATVATNGTITAVAPGTAQIKATSNDGGKSAVCKVTVKKAKTAAELQAEAQKKAAEEAAAKQAAAQKAAAQKAQQQAQQAAKAAASGRDPQLLYNTTNQILTAARNGTVTVKAAQPMAYDTNVATALQMRPDVTLVANFPFQGHQFNMIVPKGKWLASQLTGGYVSWLTLCAQQPTVTVQMLN